MNIVSTYSVNAGDTGPDRWWQQVLALGCLPEAQVQTESPQKTAMSAAFIVMP